MTISFILNGEDVQIRAEAEQRLIDILRGSFNLAGTKSSCNMGCCGLCSVIFNGEVIKSCLIPALRVRGSEIITIEGFSQTDEYQDILHGFAEAGAVNCGYCSSGKILTVEALLSRSPRPSAPEIMRAFHGIRCRCTEPESLLKAVQIISDSRQRRLYGRRS
ncbi:MAG: 2Fe-2S iron-sulfur cluster-binding protein [Treponema sp.]|nr:2Fe-2S iron-sulfur cluster-binding protein [Treponema sp.]